MAVFQPALPSHLVLDMPSTHVSRGSTHRRFAVLMLLAMAGCQDPSGPGVELPWDPNGIWVAEVEGILYGEPFIDTLRVELLAGNRFVTEGSGAVLVTFGGSWQFATEEGPLDGFWWAGLDEDASSSGECPESSVACSVSLRLQPEFVDVCTGAQPGRPPVPIEIEGWFAGADAIVGAALEGSFQEFQLAPPPCEGVVIIAFDTSVELARSEG